MAVFLGESFDGGFAINHCGNNLALFASFLGADNDEVAIADCEIDHRIPHNFEHEEFALSDEGLGEWEDFLDVLFGKDWATGGDSTNEWDIDCLLGLDGVGFVGVGDFKGATFGGIFSDESFFD